MDLTISITLDDVRNLEKPCGTKLQDVEILKILEDNKQRLRESIRAGVLESLSDALKAVNEDRVSLSIN